LLVGGPTYVRKRGHAGVVSPGGGTDFGGNYWGAILAMRGGGKVVPQDGNLGLGGVRGSVTRVEKGGVWKRGRTREVRRVGVELGSCEKRG